MPSKRLTDKGVERLRPGPARREIPDAVAGGLYLIVQPSGKKSWAVRARLAGRPLKFTLKGVVGVAAAREAAREALDAIARGEDPRVLRREREAATVEAVVEDWLRRDQAGNRTHDEVEAMFDRRVVPRWGPRPVTSITRRDVVALLDEVVDDGAPVAANRLATALGRFFNWCAARDVVPVNPIARLPKPTPERSRDRVLSDSELVAVWGACDAIGWPFGPAVRLLVLTGARRSEVGALRWSEVGERELRLDAGRVGTKNGEPRLIPLSAPAREILATLPRVGRSGYVFTTRGKPVSGWSKAKRTLDEVSEVEGWRLHDLRRTIATGLQRLGQRLEVIEAVLGHTAGSRAGIVGVYQRHAFEPEKRRALDAWGRHLLKIVEGEAAKVVALRR